MLATMGYIVPEYFRFPGTEVLFSSLLDLGSLAIRFYESETLTVLYLDT